MIRSFVENSERFKGMIKDPKNKRMRLLRILKICHLDTWLDKRMFMDPKNVILQPS